MNIIQEYCDEEFAIVRINTKPNWNQIGFCVCRNIANFAPIPNWIWFGKLYGNFEDNFSEQFSETLQPREGPSHFHLLLPNTKTAAGQEPSTAKGEWVKCNQKVTLNTLHKKCHQLNSFLSHQHLHTYVNFRLDLNNRGGRSTDQQANLTRPGQACQPRLKKSTWPESCMIWNDVSNTFQCFSMVYELY